MSDVNIYIYFLTYLNLIQRNGSTRYGKNLFGLTCTILKCIFKPQGTINYDLNVSHFWHSTMGENIIEHYGILGYC